MLAAHGNGTGKTRDPAAPFFLYLDAGKRGIFRDQSAPGKPVSFQQQKVLCWLYSLTFSNKNACV